LQQASSVPLAPFWAAIANGKFLIPQCAVCGQWQSPASARCANCGSDLLAWKPGRGTGRIYSLMERLPAEPGGEAIVVAVVELDEGPRMLAAVRARPGVADAGKPVAAALTAERSPEGLPFFTLSAS